MSEKSIVLRVVARALVGASAAFILAACGMKGGIGLPTGVPAPEPLLGHPKPPAPATPPAKPATPAPDANTNQKSSD